MQEKSFLIIRLSSIGDVILTTPLIRCLRKAYPQSRIDFLVKKQFVDVIAANPHIDNIITFDTKADKELGRIKKLVKANHYTHIIDLQKNIRSIFICCGSKATYSSFSKRIFARYLLIRFHWNIYKETKPVYLRYFEALKKLGVGYDGEGTEVFPFVSDIENVENKLNQQAVQQSLAILAIAPGARWANKRWTTDGYASAINDFCDKIPAIPVFIGGKEDIAIVEQIQPLLRHHSVSFAGELTLMQSAAMLGKANVVITNDTGMLHMAQAMKAPVVAVFGPTTKELGFFPLPAKSRVAEMNLACRPCTQKGLDACPKGHFKCMKDINPQQVSKLAKELSTLHNLED